MASAEISSEDRVQELLTEHRAEIQRTTHRIFTLLMLVQWPVGVVLALFVAPLTWIGASSSVHYHVWASLILGGLFSLTPIVVARTQCPTHWIVAHTFAVSQMLWSSLFIHLSGGRLETHFHVFGSLAVVAFYRDWRVLITASVVVSLDHWVRGVYWPQSVFGVFAESPYRWLEHAGWVGFEISFLIPASLRSQREMREIARRRAQLEQANMRVEGEVRSRTRDLVFALDEAQAAERAKTQFLANMSHEIRTPMNSILGFTEVLQSGTSNEAEGEELLQTIHRNGEHLLEIINQILDYSKLEIGEYSVELVGVDVRQLVQEVRDQFAMDAKARDLDLEIEHEEGTPQKVSSDPLRLRQILINLVGNALKFTEAGSVRISTRSVASRLGPQLQISVQDTGIGMDPDQTEALFEEFTQADASTTRRFGGTGLGLAISRRLARLLGGDITVTSEVGKGSTFYVRVAVFLGAPRGAADEPIDNVPETPPLESAEKRECKRILVVEDGADNRRLVRAFLRKEPIEIVETENGALGVEAFEESIREGRPFDLILMDMQMPVLDGYQATTRIRELGCDLPIVAVTAHAMAEDRQKCLDAGCTEHLSKPVSRAKLLATIREMTERAIHR